MGGGALFAHLSRRLTPSPLATKPPPRPPFSLTLSHFLLAMVGLTLLTLRQPFAEPLWGPVLIGVALVWLLAAKDYMSHEPTSEVLQAIGLSSSVLVGVVTKCLLSFRLM